MILKWREQDGKEKYHYIDKFNCTFDNLFPAGNKMGCHSSRGSPPHWKFAKGSVRLTQLIFFHLSIQTNSHLFFSLRSITCKMCKHCVFCKLHANKALQLAITSGIRGREGILLKRLKVKKNLLATFLFRTNFWSRFSVFLLVRSPFRDFLSAASLHFLHF